jgi:hypothetical protein
MDARTARRINRAHWDALAAAHGQDAYHDYRARVDGELLPLLFTLVAAKP